MKEQVGTGQVFKIKITQTFSSTIEVQADSLEDATAIVKANHAAGKYNQELIMLPQYYECCFEEL